MDKGPADGAGLDEGPGVGTDDGVVLAEGWRARECKRFGTFKGRASVFSPPNDTPWHAFEHRRFGIARKF